MNSSTAYLAVQSSAHLKAGDIQGKLGQTLLLHSLPNLSAQRVLLLGIGKEAELSDRATRKLITALLNVLKNLSIKECRTQALPIVRIKNRDAYASARFSTECLADGLYVFDQCQN